MHTLSLLARQILRDPVGGARALVALDLPERALWSALLAAVAIDTILSTLWIARFVSLYGAEMPPELTAGMVSSTASPLLNAGVQALYWFVGVHVLHRLGRAFGGQGDLRASLHVVLAIQAVNIGLLALLLALLLVAPGLVVPVMLAGLAGAIWLVSGLIRGLHGFASRLGVIAVMVPAIFAILLAVATLVGWLLGPMV